MYDETGTMCVCVLNSVHKDMWRAFITTAVTKTEAEDLIMLCSSWMFKAEEGTDMSDIKMMPSQHPNRRHIGVAVYMHRDGSTRSWIIPYILNSGKPDEIGEWEEQETTDMKSRFLEGVFNGGKMGTVGLRAIPFVGSGTVDDVEQAKEWNVDEEGDRGGEDDP